MMDENEWINERMWGLYVAECDRTKTRPSPKDFLVWLDDNDYDYEPI